MFRLYVNSVSHFYVTSLVTTPKIYILAFKWYRCLRCVIDKILSFVMKSHLITSNYVSIDVVCVVPQSIWERTELSFLHVQSISLCCIWCKYKSDGCAFFLSGVPNYCFESMIWLYMETVLLYNDILIFINLHIYLQFSICSY